MLLSKLFLGTNYYMIYYNQEPYGSKNENDFKSLNENDFKSLNFEKLASKSKKQGFKKSKPGIDLLWKLNLKFILACLSPMHFIKIGRKVTLPVITLKGKKTTTCFSGQI